jgi:hypothetical protein
MVVLVDISPDCLDQSLDAPENAATDAFVGDLAEPAFDQIRPGIAQRE